MSIIGQAFELMGELGKRVPWGEFKKSELQNLINDIGRVGPEFVRFLKNGGRVEVIVTAFPYIVPLADADVPEGYQATLAKYRQLAREYGVPDSHAVCYRVPEGFTLKTHAPMAGPCDRRFGYLQDWNFPDQPTQNSLVFWVPRILEESTNLSVIDQSALLAALRGKLELPAHHMSGFGNAALIAGLMLAHFKATGKIIAPIARTDTCTAEDGHFLSLSWIYDAEETRLDCWTFPFDWEPDGGVGVIALGVEVLDT